MDEMTAYAACAAVHNDDGEAERWFGAVIGAYQDLAEPADWDAYQAALTESAASEGLPATTVEQFVTYLGQQPTPMEIVADMSAQRPDELLEVYRGWLASASDASAAAAATEAVQAGPDGQAPEDEATWNAYLAQNGPYWDGTEAAWPGFREWFLYHAHAAGVGNSAAAFLTYADGEPDRVGVFAEYGIQIAQPSAAAEEGTADATAEAATAQYVEQVVTAIADSVISDFRAQYPQFAELSNEDLRSMIAAEVSDQAAPAPQSA